MSDVLIIGGVMLLAAGAAVSLIVSLGLLTGVTEVAEDQGWRDPAPPMFRMLMPLARRYARHLRLSEERHERIRADLAAAGLSYALLPSEFIVVRRLAAGVCVLLAVYFIYLGGLGTDLSLVLVIGLPIAGYLYPRIWLRDAILRRQREFERQFPFFLELLGLSMRAGLTFSGALQQACVQMPAGSARDEFNRVIRDVRTGQSRAGALQSLADRVKLSSVSSFVAAVVQAEEAGGSLGAVMADQARQRRQERFARAEKLANEAPVKMLLPLVGLLFPITFIIIGFPIVLEFIDSGASSFLQ